MSKGLQIPLTRGLFALIDYDDLSLIVGHRWCAAANGYAVRATQRNGDHKRFYMHRIIANAMPDEQVDHINGNRLDNRQSNLRICSHHQNNMNRNIGRANTSGYKGVVWHKRAQKWMAQSKSNGQRAYLGLFETKEEAAAAYNVFAREHFGAFAKINDGVE